MALNHTSKYSELTEEHFSLIGKVVVEWSNVEFILGSILSRLLFTPEFPGRVFSSGMGAMKIQRAIDEAVELHKLRYRTEIVSEEKLAEITSINKKLNKLRKTRNQFAHFCWARSNDDEIFGVGFSSATAGSKREGKDFVTLKVNELRDFYSQLYEVVDDLSKVLESLPEMEEDRISTKLTK
ncbi:hypothetical protein [Alcanivorax sp.]|uniref:hypothetical protein n=1 Tax=Alcanivorax sp. TaxID=1872427 RepID=UPI0025896227|nr:hypothetical protein [Alcanivorax sp.]